MNHDKARAERPPLGLTPKRVHDQIRQVEILEAMYRYSSAGKVIPPEWIIELGDVSFCLRQTPSIAIPTGDANT